MFCSGARLILVVSVSSRIVLFCKPVNMGEKITVRWWWWECFVMPIVMESSMISYSIDKFISNHTNVGFNFEKVDGSIWFINNGGQAGVTQKTRLQSTWLSTLSLGKIWFLWRVSALIPKEPRALQSSFTTSEENWSQWGSGGWLAVPHSWSWWWFVVKLISRARLVLTSL